MPKREVLYRGNFFTVELALTGNGRCPGKKFLNSLTKNDREKFYEYKVLADQGFANEFEKRT